MLVYIKLSYQAVEKISHDTLFREFNAHLVNDSSIKDFGSVILFIPVKIQQFIITFFHCINTIKTPWLVLR